MIKRRISISLMAALMLVTIPSAQAGKYLSYDTPWKITCPGNVLGTLNLTSKILLGSSPTDCSSSGTNTTNSGRVHTSGSTAPTSWTWTMPGCFNIHNAPITGKIGVGVPYNCFANPDGSGSLISTGSITVGTPVGSTLP